MVRLGHVHLPVPELARSVAFYRDQLGLEAGFTSDSMAEFPAAGLVLDQESGFTRSPAPVTVGLAVDDVDSVFAGLAGRGVPVTEPPRDRSWGVPEFLRYGSSWIRNRVRAAEDRAGLRITAGSDVPGRARHAV